MSLDEEIAVYRFGQGVYPVEVVLEHAAGLGEHERWWWLRTFYELIAQQKPVAEDSDQAMVSSGLDPADPAYNTFKEDLTAGLSRISAGEDNQTIKLLLHVFKRAYQRQLALNKDNSSSWRYADLSQDETVQNLLAKHRLLAEEIYADPSFRSEFTTLAKLWHNRRSQGPVGVPSGSRRQTNAAYVSYDDLITESANYFTNKNLYAESLLHKALRKGVAVRYKLDKRESLRLLTDVLERYMNETYGTNPLP
ncbi:hypothetical protein J2I47_25685 [Fibrella sp. HMF5335]|uniref:Uncharacterized protein n=1 Tax=Fibrella rubiginis TaxID=2817060 RepID=A0A939GNZ3_9BACT|nr:DUF5958 family protein [Fibrella rubiginis]MBO0939963.1 hypothetical protein [Fibrella rubiginis]